MGMPLQNSGTENDKATSSSEEPSTAILESTDMEVDPAQNLEEKAKQALDCPCVANLRNGPCGSQFSTAFVCYVKSQESEKGSDCVESFKRMQECMLENQKHYMVSPQPSRDRRSADEDEKIDNKENGDLERFRRDLQEGPPAVPQEAIKYPPWYEVEKN